MCPYYITCWLTNPPVLYLHLSDPVLPGHLVLYFPLVLLVSLLPSHFTSISPTSYHHNHITIILPRCHPNHITTTTIKSPPPYHSALCTCHGTALFSLSHAFLPAMHHLHHHHGPQAGGGEGGCYLHILIITLLHNNK